MKDLIEQSLRQVHKDIDTHWLKLYHEKTGELPRLSWILDVVDIAIRHDSHANVKYANQLYHILLDLTKEVYYDMVSIVEINEQEYSVTYKKIRYYKDKFRADPEILVVSSYSEKPEVFDSLYKGKDLNILGLETYRFGTTKIDAYYSQRKTELGVKKVLDQLETVTGLKPGEESLIGEPGFLKKEFEHVLNRLVRPITFEEYIEENLGAFNSESEDYILRLVEKEIESEEGRKYFKSPKDHDRFIGSFTSYFKDSKYEPPVPVIQTIGNKQKVGRILRKIYKTIKGKNANLKGDNTYLRFISESISQFEGALIENIYEDIVKL